MTSIAKLWSRAKHCLVHERQTFLSLQYLAIWIHLQPLFTIVHWHLISLTFAPFFCWFLPRGKGTEIWPSIAFRASWKQINWAKDANCKRWIKIWLILILPIHIRIPSYSRGKLIGPPRLRVESNNRCTFYTHRPARSPDHSKHAQKAQNICWLLQIWAAFSSCSKTLIVSWRWNARSMRRRIQVHWFIMVHIES